VKQKWKQTLGIPFQTILWKRKQLRTKRGSGSLWQYSNWEFL